MARTRNRRCEGRRRPSVLEIAPALALFTVMAVPWLTTQAYQAQDAQVVPFALAAHDGLFSAPDRYKAGGAAPTSLATGDLNGDGVPDVAVALDDSRAVGILLSKGLEGFAKSLRFHTGETPTSVAIGDIDGDGDRDVVVGHQFAPLQVLRSDGHGGFVRYQASADESTGRWSIYGFKLADVDGDSDLDVFGLGRRGRVINLINDGHGMFTGPPVKTADPIDGGFVLGDLNGDGYQDAAYYVHPSASSKHPRAKVAVRLGDGKGGFGKARIFDTGLTLPPEPPARPTPPANDPHADVLYARPGVEGRGGVAISDLDRDGKLDLVVTQTAAEGFAILHGTGRGTFKQAVRVGPGVQGPTNPLVVDFDKDRVPDLVAFEEGSPKIVVLLGKRGGGFERPQRYRAMRDSAYKMASADLDGDGRPDLILSDANRNDVVILYTQVTRAIPR